MTVARIGSYARFGFPTYTKSQPPLKITNFGIHITPEYQITKRPSAYAGSMAGVVKVVKTKLGWKVGCGLNSVAEMEYEGERMLEHCNKVDIDKKMRVRFYVSFWSAI